MRVKSKNHCLPPFSPPTWCAAPFWSFATIQILRARVSDKFGFTFNRGFKSDKLAAGKYITRHVVIVHQLIHRCRGLCFLPKGNTALHTAVTCHVSSRRCAAAARCHQPFAAFRPCSPPAYGSHVTRHASRVTRHTSPTLHSGSANAMRMQ